MVQHDHGTLILPCSNTLTNPHKVFAHSLSDPLASSGACILLEISNNSFGNSDQTADVGACFICRVRIIYLIDVAGPYSGMVAALVNDLKPSHEGGVAQGENSSFLGLHFLHTVLMVQCHNLLLEP